MTSGENATIEKPDLETVLKYAKPIIFKFIAKYAQALPFEQKEEIEQEAYIRIMKAYPRLDPTLGWKSFAYYQSRGAVQDYVKAGTGFEEDSWNIKKKEEKGAVHENKLKNRIELIGTDGEDVDIEMMLGVYGKFSEVELDLPTIKWDVLAKLASEDKELHAFLKHIRGQNHEVIAAVFGTSRASVGQMIEDFINRFDDPAWAIEYSKKPWMDQVIWALGLGRVFNIPDCDQSKIYDMPLGQHAIPVDLNNATPKVTNETHLQMKMF